MARTRARPTAAPPAKVEINIQVPQATSITITDLRGKSDEEIRDLLEKAKTAKVSYIVRNAPFKVRPVEPVF